MEHWRPVAKPNKQGEYTAEDSEFIAKLDKLDKSKQYNGLRRSENGWEIDLLAFDTVEKVEKLSPYWVKQNADAAQFVSDLVIDTEEAGKDVNAEVLAEDVHNAWGSRVGAFDGKEWHSNGWSPDGQCQPYAKLERSEKDKDMAHVEIARRCAAELGIPLDCIKFPQQGTEQSV